MQPGAVGATTRSQGDGRARTIPYPSVDGTRASRLVGRQPLVPLVPLPGPELGLGIVFGFAKGKEGTLELRKVHILAGHPALLRHTGA